MTAPIYPEQNNGNPEGPVGTDVLVRGSGWTPEDGTANVGGVDITLADERNDTPGQPGSACQNGAPQITLPFVESAYAPQGSNGSFNGSFHWPVEAGIKGHSYWACGKQEAPGRTAVGVSKFTVLSAYPPTVVVNVSQAAPGSHITVTGHNWLPGGVQVNIFITPCVGCNCNNCSNPPFYTSTQVTSQADGSFNASAQVPPDAPIGTTLYVTAQSIDPNNPSAGNSGTLSAGLSLLTRFTVGVQTTPIPTAVSTPTAVNTAQAGGANGNSSNTALMVLLASSNALLFIVVIVLILLYLRLRSQAPGAPGGDSSRSGGTGGHALPGARYSGPPAYPDASVGYDDAQPSLSGPQGQEWGNADGREHH